MNTSNHHHKTFFAGITLFLSFFAATAFGQPAALTPALVKTVRQCTQIGSFHEGMAVACKNGRYGYIRRDGRWAVRPKYEMAFDFSEGRGAVVKNGRLGFVDSTGREVIACRYYYGGWFDPYNYYNHFNCGLAVLLLNGKFGAIDRTGEVRIPFGRFDKIYHFDNGVAFAREKGGKMVIIDTNGNICYRLPDSLRFDYPYRSGKRCLAALLSDDAEDTCGLIDTKGVVLMPPRPGRFTYLNEDRTILLHFYSHCDMIDWNKDSCYTKYNYVYDLVRQRELPFDTMEIKRLLELNQLMPSYSEGKCFAKKEVDGKKRVVVQDSSGQELWTLPLGVYDFQPWSEGFSVVRLKDGQHLSCGLMDAAGRLSFTAEQLREAER
ncbi:MAG: WG repeat-containing protein, partial [Bacteroidales bacterium]|nr:WG repeat-containing protein [Bacteroidales bacterium]